MSEPKKSIFRPQAVARYMDQQQEPVFPKIIGPRLFPKLWVLIALLFAGLFLVGWLPVSQKQTHRATLFPSQPTETTWLLAVESAKGLHIELNARVELRGSRAQPVSGSVSHISPPLQGPTWLPQKYAFLNSHSAQLTWPLRLVVVQPDGIFRQNEADSSVELAIIRPSLRIFDYLPGI